MIKIYPYIFSLLACIGIALPGYSQVDWNMRLKQVSALAAQPRFPFR